MILLLVAVALLGKPTTSQALSLMDRAISGLPANNDGRQPALPHWGDQLAFSSTATDLVLLPTANEDVYLFQIGAIRQMSADSSGTRGNDHSSQPVFSGDGTMLAFKSRAGNLVNGDTNLTEDIFVVNTIGGAYPVRASVSTAGVQIPGTAGCANPFLNYDGTLLVFDSTADNLVSGDGNTATDVFLRNLTLNQTTRLSVNPGNSQEGNGESGQPSISYDGNYVAFRSWADNLVAGDDNGTWDIFVLDRGGNQMTRVSVSSGGVQANSSSSNPRISGNGRYVVFTSQADNLVAGDDNTYEDVFLHDLQTHQTELISKRADGNQTNRESDYAVVSADGRFVVFQSSDDYIVPGDANGEADIFVLDRATGWISCPSLGSDGYNFAPAISGDGRKVAFASQSTTFHPLVSSEDSHIYLRSTMNPGAACLPLLPSH